MIAKGLSILACLALLGAADAGAQDYPRKPITVVVPFAAGGPTDTVARLLGVAMGKSLKTQIIVENVGGAGGTIGAARVAKAPPDGYTILLHNIGHATAPALYRKLPYDTVGDFEPIGLVNDVPMTLVAKKDFPPNTLRELIAYLKANKDKVSYANAGLGSASHLCGMLFMSAIDTDLTTVPYKGTGPAMNDLLGGQVDLMCDQTDEHDQPDQGGQDQGVRRHDQDARAFPAGDPDHAGGRPAGLRGLGLARLLRAEGHAEGRRSTSWPGRSRTPSGTRRSSSGSRISGPRAWPRAARRPRRSART